MTGDGAVNVKGISLVESLIWMENVHVSEQDYQIGGGEGEIRWYKALRAALISKHLPQMESLTLADFVRAEESLQTVQNLLHQLKRSLP